MNNKKSVGSSVQVWRAGPSSRNVWSAVPKRRVAELTGKKPAPKSVEVRAPSEKLELIASQSDWLKNLVSIVLWESSVTHTPGNVDEFTQYLCSVVREPRFEIARRKREQAENRKAKERRLGSKRKRKRRRHTADT